MVGHRRLYKSKVEPHYLCTWRFHSAESICGTDLKRKKCHKRLVISYHWLDVLGLRERRCASTAPWPQPARVTELGLPPNSATACNDNRSTESYLQVCHPPAGSSPELGQHQRDPDFLADTWSRLRETRGGQSWNEHSQSIWIVTTEAEPVLKRNHHQLLSHQSGPAQVPSALYILKSDFSSFWIKLTLELLASKKHDDRSQGQTDTGLPVASVRLNLRTRQEKN